MIRNNGLNFRYSNKFKSFKFYIKSYQKKKQNLTKNKANHKVVIDTVKAEKPEAEIELQKI